jgi:hypothetical protein
VPATSGGLPRATPFERDLSRLVRPTPCEARQRCGGRQGPGRSGRGCEGVIRITPPLTETCQSDRLAASDAATCSGVSTDPSWSVTPARTRTCQ